LNFNWNDSSFTPFLKTGLKTSDKSISLCFWKRKAITQGQMTKQQERRARHEQHIIDLTINGANFPPVSVSSSDCSSQGQPSVPAAWESSLLKW
jgi:hypothetical protein